MTRDIPPGRGRATGGRSPIEGALRYIGGQRGGQLSALLQNAIAWASGDAGVALGPLTRPADVLADWTADEKAAAVELLIKEGVEHPSVGPSEHSRERRVLRAALRLPDPDIDDAWAPTLNERWNQLKVLEQLFPQVSTTTMQPMEAAWTRGVRLLSIYLGRRFEELAASQDWSPYRAPEMKRGVVRELARDSHFRKPSDGAQPFVVNRMVVTVLVAQRNVQRRIVERIVTAQDDGVEFYLSMVYTAGFNFGRTYVPTVALWGCRAESAPILYPNEFIATRRRFPRPLRRGEQTYFASESIYEGGEPPNEDERNWVEVEVDHHGIEAGSADFGGTFPLRGLTIRVRFEENDPPRSAWWYAEATELERYEEPTPGSGRLLPIKGGEVCHTFGDACEPRERFGIAYMWVAR